MKAILLSTLLSGGILFGIHTDDECENEIAGLNSQVDSLIDEVNRLQSDLELSSNSLEETTSVIEQLDQKLSFTKTQHENSLKRIKDLENELANCGKNK